MRSVKNMVTALGVIGVSAALALTGCSNADNGSADTADSNGKAAGHEKAWDVNPQDRDKLQQGGELRFAISQLPTNWNTQSNDGNQVDNEDIWKWTGAQLLVSDEKGELSWNKNYLDDVKVEEAKDGAPQKITMKISDKAKWNSGRDIEAEDFISLWKAMNGTNEAFKPATTDGYDQMANVEAGASNKEVIITFKSSYPDWQAPLSGIYPKELTSDPEMFNTGLTEPKNEWLAGPYKFDKIDKSQRVATLVPNEKWWGDKPLLDKVSFRELSPSASSQAFANNEIDVLQPIINADGYQKAQQRSDGEIRETPGAQWRHVTFNAEGKNLGDVKVRQAITRAINREAIAKSDLAGLPVADHVEEVMLGNHFFMPGQDGYKDNGEKWSYDPKAAEKLLDEAGWKLPEGKKVREKDGQPLEIEYGLIKDVPTSENEGKLIQADLAKVGIDLKLVTKAQDEFPQFMIDGEFGLTTFTWRGTIFPMNNIGQIYGTGQESNYARISNPELDKLREQADVEMDRSKRVDLTNQIDAMIWESGHTLPLYRRVDYTAVPKNLANFGAFGLASLQPENVGFVK